MSVLDVNIKKLIQLATMCNDFESAFEEIIELIESDSYLPDEMLKTVLSLAKETLDNARRQR